MCGAGVPSRAGEPRFVSAPWVDPLPGMYRPPVVVSANSTKQGPAAREAVGGEEVVSTAGAPLPLRGPTPT